MVPLWNAPLNRWQQHQKKINLPVIFPSAILRAEVTGKADGRLLKNPVMQGFLTPQSSAIKIYF